MALTKKEAAGTNRFEIGFSVDKETFDKAVSDVFNKKKGSITVPGFRRGKAPRHIVEQMYGKGVFYEDAVNEVMPAAYEAAIKEAELDVVGQPEIDIEKIDENGAAFKAVVYVKPEVKIEGYLGIEAEKETVKVTDEEVDAEVKRVQERNGRTVEVTDRAAENGDTVNIDYKGTVDGVAFDGGAAEKYDLRLGSGSFIPGFEDQIVGKKIGDAFDVKVTFPADYHAKELAGKDAVFACKLNGVKTTELPALDDEFAKDVSEFDTLSEYKADVRANIQKRKEQSADAAFENALSEKLIDLVKADIPEPMYVAETENYVRDYDTRLRQQGLDLKTYFKYTGQTLDDLRKQMRPMAEKQVKVRLALETIARLENLTVADEKVEEEYKNISDAYSVPVEQVKGMVDAEDIRRDLLVKAAMDLVKEKAVVKAPKAKAAPKTAAPKAKAPAKTAKSAEEKPTEEKPAAKKPAAKTATAAKKPAGSTAAKTTAAKKPAAKKPAADK
ncbi:MAG: trigger factor [Clostridia bacterium]|nr:trigger factor [Clostridia bacterium]